jgi:zinc protease
MNLKHQLTILGLLFTLFAVAQTGTTSALPAGVRLVETVNAQSGKLTIPYKKYVFPNGLTLLVHEDNSDPVVHIDVTYHVGSGREVNGRSGFAHFFEHMMFQGSDNVGDEEHFKLVTAAGGDLNGTTNRDRTNYFETLPSNQLETGLWLEADRMGFFLDAVTQEKFEVQRETVKNERGQNYDNRPYGLVSEKTGEVLYPFNHPYSWTTIGYIADLNAATLDDLKRFFLRWYGPNNAVLTVAGDVKASQVVQLVNKYFGPIPRGPEVKNKDKQLVTLTENKYISYEDNIRFPLWKATFPSVHNYHADEAALDILSDLLGGGNNSILYKNLVKTQKALQANASNPCSELAGEFSIQVLPYPGTTLKEVQDIVQQSLKEFEEKGVSEEAIKRFKAQYELQLMENLQTVSGKASSLASYYTFTGNANFIQKDLERYQNVTTKDVMDAFNKYIKNKPAVYLTVYPKGQDSIVLTPDNAKRPDIPEGFKNDLTEYQNLTYVKAKDNFDRSVQPKPGPNPLVKMPKIWEATIGANKIPVIGTYYTELPVVSMQLNFDGGHLIEPLEKSGLSVLTANMMDESTRNFTTEEIADKLEKLGSRIDISSANEALTINVLSLKKNLQPTLDLLKEKLLSPAFNEEDFARVKQQQLEILKNNTTQPTEIAQSISRKVSYAAEHPFSVSFNGTVESINSITLDEVKAFYARQISSNLLKVTVVGNELKEAVLPKLNFLSSIKDSKTTLPEFKAMNKVTETKIYFYDKTNAAQSVVRLMGNGLTYDAYGNYFKSGLMNFPLGRAFNSRINLNLRELRGITYGARSFFNGSKFADNYIAAGSIKKDSTHVGIREFIKEISNYKQSGITDEEFKFTKDAIGQSDALEYESLYQKAGFLAQILEYNLDKNFTEKQKSILNTITKQEINELAAKFLPEHHHIIVVGDKKTVFEDLKSLNIPITEVDVNGNILQ